MRVDGRVLNNPLHHVVLGRARLTLDDTAQRRQPWRAIAFHKPRGIVTTRRDPEGRRTIYDVLGDAASGLVAVGRLDLASSGLLLLTNDTQLANWMTDPVNAVPRVYLVTVRGEVTPDAAAALGQVTIRKASRRETHLIVKLQQGRNREIRKMFAAIGREVTRLKRVSVGGLEIGGLEPGTWRDVTAADIRAAFPTASSLPSIRG